MTGTATSPTKSTNRPPRDGLVRAWRPGLEVLRSDDGDKEILKGHFAVWNRWTEIDSWVEGNFMERIAPGACKKTFREQRGAMRVLLQHGRDPQLGDKPIASIDVLREDAEGAYYEAPLFKGLPDLVVEGLRAEQYGASFRFRVMREEFNDEPGVSDHNPKGIPERTIKEMQVFEFGPVTFPAYSEATAGLRSLTDAFLFAQFSQADPERFRALLEQAKPMGAKVPEVPTATAASSGTVANVTIVNQAADGTDAVEEDEEDRSDEIEAEVPETPEAEAEETREEEQAESVVREETEDAKLDNQTDAAPDEESTPLNTTIPRSKRRGNPWELPSSRRPVRRTLPPRF